MSKISNWLASAASTNMGTPTSDFRSLPPALLSQVWERPPGSWLSLLMGTRMETKRVGIWAPTVWLPLSRMPWSSPGERCGVSRRTGLAECSKFRRGLGCALCGFRLVPKLGACWCFSSLVSPRGGEAAALSGS